MSKRSYTNFLDKNEFPFNIENNKIIFPKLLSKMNNSNKIRYWKIYSYLKNNDTNEMLALNIELINNNKFNELLKIYSKIKMYIYTEYGQINGKLTKTEPTIITEGKNINKSNETTILTQGLIYMRNLYLKKIKSGYVTKLNEINNENIFPMALNVYNKYKKYIQYPCYIQPKLDGVRVITHLENNKIKLMSRRLNEYLGFNFIIDELIIILKNYPELILDGELYNHELTLQQISGIVRNEDINNTNKKKLKFYIFDCINIKNNYSFEERFNILKDIFNNNTFNYLILTDTILVKSEQESDKYYNDYINKNYEGIVYKNVNATYEYSSYKEIRSMQFLKRKKNYDAEYPIIGFEEGLHGKDKGAIIFIMKTPDNKEFKAVPNMSLKDRKNMYKLAKNNFDQIYKNKMATISFDEYSNDNIPLRAKFITIRNYE
jgi:DNA ligase-1